VKTVLFFLFCFKVFAGDTDLVAKVNDTYITKYDLKQSGKTLNLFITDIIKKQAIEQNKVEFNEEEFENSSFKSQNDYLWDKLIYKNIAPTILITNKEIEDLLEYQGNSEFRIRYNISQIMIYKNTNNENIANKLYEEIKNNNNFEKLAKKFSEYNKEKSGLVGWVDKKELNKSIFEAINLLPAGQTTTPILINNYYLLIKLNNREKIKIIRNEDIYRAKKFLFEKKLSLAVAGYYDDLYKNSLIEIR
jgi:parvulin-like peptidyl-prolyl isomerase